MTRSKRRIMINSQDSRELPSTEVSVSRGGAAASDPLFCPPIRARGVPSLAAAA
jgi:hypothetical protein